MSKEIWRKVTGKGAVLVASLGDDGLSATVDGKAIDAAVRILAAPKSVGGKTVVAQIGPIGLTREEYDALLLAWRGPAPAPVSERYRHAEAYSDEARAFDRGYERRTIGE